MILSLKWDHCLLLWFVLMCSPSVVDIVHTFGCNKSEVPTHTHTHTVCSVFCVYGSVCVTHGHIWISKSVCVCLCQGSVWAFELLPSCVASHGCPMGTLSSSIWLMSEWNQTGRREGKKRERNEEGREETTVKTNPSTASVFCSFTKMVQLVTLCLHLWPAGYMSVSVGSGGGLSNKMLM